MKNNFIKNTILFFVIFFTFLNLIMISHYFSNTKNNTISQNKIQNTNTNIFSFKETETIEIVKEPDITITMAVTGDIMCHNTMYYDAYNHSTSTYDFSHFFSDVKPYLENADITIGNLETTFAGSERGYSGYPTFNTPEALAQNLKEVGFDVLSTANNHSLDKGFSGLSSTLSYLDEANIYHTGTFVSEEDSQKILMLDVNGISIALLSFTYGTNGIPVPQGKEFCINLIDKEKILKQLNLAKEQSPDIICVCMHWGLEYQTIPNDTQKELKDFLLKNGADIILGNHPHVLQPMEKNIITLDDGTIKEGIVIYSLGNFMADQKAKYTRNSAIVHLKITKNGETNKVSINNIDYIPIYIYKDNKKTKQKFKLLDINSTIQNYHLETNKSINETTYHTLITELDNIKQCIGNKLN